MNPCKKKKNNWCTVYNSEAMFICIYDFLKFFFFYCIVSYQASKTHLLCAVYKCWGWTESTKFYIYSSQKGHDRRKIEGETIFGRLEISKNKKNNWDMKWSLSHNHTKSNVEAHWNSKEKKKLVDAESASSNALGWIVLDLDIWVRFDFNYGIGFKINFVLSILF